MEFGFKMPIEAETASTVCVCVCVRVCVCGRLKGSTQSALTLSNVAGIFYILASGLALSIIVSLGEYMSKKQADDHDNNVC